MAPSAKSCPTYVLKYVCKLMKQPSPKYTPISKDGGCLSYVKVMNSQYVGVIGRSLAEARATAARNALKKILEDNRDILKTDDLVQEYLARIMFEDKEELEVKSIPIRRRQPSVFHMNYVEALTSIRSVQVDGLLEAMKKHKGREEREKFMSMSSEERAKWVESRNETPSL